jgi:hypothetical protein
MQCSKCDEHFAATPLTDLIRRLCPDCERIWKIIRNISADHFAYAVAEDLTEVELSKFMTPAGAVRQCNLRQVANDFALMSSEHVSEKAVFELLYSVLLETLGAGNILGQQREKILAHFGIIEAEKFEAPPSPDYPTFEQFSAGGNVAHTPPLAYAAGYDHGFMDGQRRGPAPKPADSPQPVEEPPPFVPQPCGVSSKVEGGEMRCALELGHPGDWHKDASGLEFQVRG